MDVSLTTSDIKIRTSPQDAHLMSLVASLECGPCLAVHGDPLTSDLELHPWDVDLRPGTIRREALASGRGRRWRGREGGR
jgi:hypothetical protein